MGALVTAGRRDALEQPLGSAELRGGTGGAASRRSKAEDGRYTIALQRVVYGRDSRAKARGFRLSRPFGRAWVTTQPTRGQFCADGRRSTSGCLRAPAETRTAHVRRLVERASRVPLERSKSCT